MRSSSAGGDHEGIRGIDEQGTGKLKRMLIHSSVDERESSETHRWVKTLVISPRKSRLNPSLATPRELPLLCPRPHFNATGLYAGTPPSQGHPLLYQRTSGTLRPGSVRMSPINKFVVRADAGGQAEEEISSMNACDRPRRRTRAAWDTRIIPYGQKLLIAEETCE